MTSVMPRKEHTVTEITPEIKAKALKRLSKAKTSLVLGHPFFGNVAMNMPFVLDNTIPTAATNGEHIKFNTDFLDTLTDEEVVFLVAHECCHPMLEHPFRRNNRNPRKFNQAGDYVINQLLSDEGVGKMPDVGLKDDHIYKAGGGTTDGIYNILPDDDNGNEGGSGGDPIDWCDDNDGTPAEKEQKAAEWKVRVAQAAQAAKMMGKMSANIARLVDEVLSPKVDWRDVLRKFVERCKNDSRTWARFNRRFIGQGIFLPSVSGEALGELAFMIDCSGSITDDILNQFAAEIHFVKEELNPSVIHVIYFDSDVCHYDRFGRDDELVVKPHGGGGTAFSPCFKYLEDNDIHPVAAIFLTDLYCDDFGNPPEYPVLWVSNGTDTAPFGEVVMM